jgi:hypothetical protein
VRRAPALFCLAVLAAAAAGAGAAGCGASTAVDRTLPGAGVHVVRVENFAGDVSIESWNDGSAVRLRAEVLGPNAPAVAAVRTDLVRTGDVVTASLVPPPGVAGLRAEVLLNVPPGVALEVVNRGGPVYVLGSFSGLKVRNAGGLVRAYGANGPVDVENVQGSISIEGAIPFFHVKTDVGRVRIASDLEGALTGDSTATVERGRLGVTLPAAGRATVEASTKLGRLVTNCGIAVEEIGDGGRMVGTVGGGGPSLTLRIAAGTVGVWRGVL